ncbi:MAG TPA: ComF family protein [Verrucomicrobiae bacterium]|nr:ComF family protein [Verrucomicrobiae bacterium]
MSGLLESAKDWLNVGLGFVYPEVCQICQEQRAGPAECFLCQDCRAAVQWVERPFCERCGLPYQGAITTTFECANCQEREWHFNWARSAVLARGNVLEVIHRYKYRRALWFEPFLAELLVKASGPGLLEGKWDAIVPVPLHPIKEREREFNQAARLGKRLSAAAQIPLNTRILRRVLPTRTQTLLNREDRLANVNRAFALRKGARLNGERLLLVDDVFTTGATTSACARVLCAGGADEVCVWTVARGI